MDYQGLLVWQSAMDLCDQIYRITHAFPRREIFGLTSRRAGYGVPDELFERVSDVKRKLDGYMGFVQRQ